MSATSVMNVAKRESQKNCQADVVTQLNPSVVVSVMPARRARVWWLVPVFVLLTAGGYW